MVPVSALSTTEQCQDSLCPDEVFFGGYVQFAMGASFYGCGTYRLTGDVAHRRRARVLSPRCC